jgi:hypothetical protein
MFKSPMFETPCTKASHSPVKKERRSWNRVPVQVTVFCQKTIGEDELCWSARVTEISRGGIKLLSPQKFEPSTVIRISRAYGGESSSEFLEASVVRVHRSPGEKWTLGCALTQELREAELAAWIERNCRVLA